MEHGRNSGSNVRGSNDLTPNQVLLDQTTETRQIVFKWWLMYHHLPMLKSVMHWCSSSIPQILTEFLDLWKSLKETQSAHANRCDFNVEIVPVFVNWNTSTLTAERGVNGPISVVSTCRSQNLLVLLWPGQTITFDKLSVYLEQTVKLFLSDPFIIPELQEFYCPGSCPPFSV